MTGRVVVLCGPSGVGKGTVVAALMQRQPQVWLSTSVTTRAPRPGEVAGVSYFFVTDDEFDQMVADSQLLEWATVHGQHRYGTPRQPVMQAVAAGRPVLLEVDRSGARQIRRSLPGAYQVFLLPPSWEELERRLRGRDTEDAATVARRLETARDELAAVDEFDAVVVNDEVADTVAQLVQLLGLGSDETNATRQVPERLTSEGT